MSAPRPMTHNHSDFPAPQAKDADARQLAHAAAMLLSVL
jgi:hypothetical protein